MRKQTENRQSSITEKDAREQYSRKWNNSNVDDKKYIIYSNV